MKPAAAPPGHVPVAVVGLGRGHRGHPPGPTGTSHTGCFESDDPDILTQIVGGGRQVITASMTGGVGAD